MQRQYHIIRRNLITLGLTTLGVTFPALAQDITGAGASFPAPIYSQWATDYQKATNTKVNYQSIGSSGGVKQIKAKTVDFGASDAPLSDDELAKAGLFQFPTVIGGVVLAVNVPGIKSGELILDGKTLGDIYLGNITKWNDPAIAKLNPSLQLPSQDIQVVFRSDGSGTSYVFTSYLAKVNEAWKDSVTKSFPEPEKGYSAGAKGNEGISATIQRQKGSIGYVEYAYAKQNKLPFVKLISADGEIVSPSAESFSNAAAGADWDRTFAQDLTNQKGKNAWPISATTFILVDKTAQDTNKTKAVLNFFNWGLTEAHAQTTALDYAPLPPSVVQTIQHAWKTNLQDNQGKSLY
ncbi:phosphate ABC transporter substrate-binding protein PstS [Spirabiliibacterium falconis]|uniref:phosphate ABC transporter substrate-binding protein PstS n=1 Tax=Spirabiliibacterium falconis TaxID=572023 RepID=UPI001AAC5F81|nr:phosphate ABC transporter substrate-binding protein PstS [Spirabiliibacterium falconis]MBE2893620.1 phosphate ABC transporter substrate-binding protein PstS [Spirabiliibacterium falconis]